MSEPFGRTLLRDLLAFTAGAAVAFTVARQLEMRRNPRPTRITPGSLTFREERLLDITIEDDPLESTVIVAEGLDDDYSDPQPARSPFDQADHDDADEDDFGSSDARNFDAADEDDEILNESDLVGPAPAPPSPLGISPTDGTCPASHAIKARFATGRFYAPGTEAYDRIVADRCYASTEEAEADGFTAGP